jgi:hypothetical protein
VRGLSYSAAAIDAALASRSQSSLLNLVIMFEPETATGRACEPGRVNVRKVTQLEHCRR